MRKRTRFGVVVTAGVLSLATLVGTTGASGTASAAGPVVWGAEIRPTAKQTYLQAVQALQTKVGRTLAATRDFLLWDSPFPTAYETGLQAQGTTVLLSVATNRIDKSPILWADLAAAQPGDALYTQMVSWADRVRDFGAPIYVTLQHEPEAASNTSEGTAADYIAAWQKWVTIFRAEGATNAKFLWILTAFAYKVPTTDRRYAAKWYPGDSYVDGIGADAYNWFTCPGFNNPWNSLQSLISGQKTFIAAHPNEEVWIPEFGSVADPANAARRAQWITAAQNLLKQPGYARYHGILYFDINGRCDTRIDTDTQALNAFKAMGADPAYQG
jgi:hypothetical protein